MPVNTPHPLHKDFVPVWRKMRDTFKGQTAVKAAGDIYLPRLTSHMPDDQTTAQIALKRYEAYKSRALFFGATENTIRAFKGMVLRKAPGLTAPDTPKSRALTDNMDLRGTSLSTMVGLAVQEMLITSRLGFLVDFPAVGEDAPRSRAEEERKNIRPFAVMYPAERIINWRVEPVNNVATLTLVVLEEWETSTASDVFVETVTPVCRVLRLDVDEAGNHFYANERYVPVKEGDTWKYPATPTTRIVVTVAGKPVPYIPFYFVTPSGSPAADPEKPVLEALADVNLAHYRNSADHENALHQIGVPTPVLTGFTPNVGADGQQSQKPIYLGADSAIVSENPEAKAEYLEFKGQGLDHLKNEMANKLSLMASLGAAALTPAKAAVESAESMGIRKQGETSVLSSVASSLEETLTNVLITMFGWDGQETAEVFLKLNKEFIGRSVDAQMLAVWLKYFQSGAMTAEQLVENLKGVDMLPYDATAQDIKDVADASDLNNRTNATGGSSSTDGANGGAAA